MNAYGGNSFDFDLSYTGYAPSVNAGSPQQQQHQQQQQYGPQQPQQQQQQQQQYGYNHYDGASNFGNPTDVFARGGAHTAVALHNAGAMTPLARPLPLPNNMVMPHPSHGSVGHNHNNTSRQPYHRSHDHSSINSSSTYPFTANQNTMIHNNNGSSDPQQQQQSQSLSEYYKDELLLFAADFAGSATAAGPFAGSSSSSYDPIAVTAMPSVPSVPSPRRSEEEEALASLTLNVPGVELEPMSAQAVLDRVRIKTDDVVTRYLPCVDFLVVCQQELRAGLVAATKKRLVVHNSQHSQHRSRSYRDALTPHQFYLKYVDPLPERFYSSNRHIMEASQLADAQAEVMKLGSDARCVEYQGCDAIKNAFLGGMRDGESWGLRRWLSKHGGALKICNDLELIFQAVQTLDKNALATKKIAEAIRPMAKQASNRLKNDVPQAYQEVSSAHPYLPFFHRLESCLSRLSNFDPEDDDVICIDDEDDDDDDDDIPQVTSSSSTSAPPKRQQQPQQQQQQETRDLPPPKRFKSEHEESVVAASTKAYDDDSDSDIEVLEVKPGPESNTVKSPFPGMQQPKQEQDVPPRDEHDQDSTHDQETQHKERRKKDEMRASWRCKQCTFLNAGNSALCAMCDDEGQDDAGSLTGSVNLAMADFDPTAATNGGIDSLWMAQFETDRETTTTGTDTTRRPSGTASSSSESVSSSASSSSAIGRADALRARIEPLMEAFENGKPDMVRPDCFRKNTKDFWSYNEPYAHVLGICSTLLQNEMSLDFLEPHDLAMTSIEGMTGYKKVVRNPLCFRDIINALDGGSNNTKRGPSDDGLLPCRNWNVWNGLDFLQAMDLIFLNCIAYHKRESSGNENDTIYHANSLRKLLWEKITDYVNQSSESHDIRKSYMPTRRGPGSGYIIYK
eukprot:scaffold335166_cov51-Attheya_sp.AAC.1